VQPVTIQRTGKRGRLKKIIDTDFLKEAMKPTRNISISKLASILNVSRETLRAYMKQNGLERRFDEISDEDLDRLVKAFRAKNPESGLRYLRGFVCRHGLRIQKERFRASMKRVDSLGQAVQVQRRKAVRRQAYRVARPNALWHIDGHHKLITWGIVIHGCVDGYSRTVSMP
jgi:hypothetical protein